MGRNVYTRHFLMIFLLTGLISCSEESSTNKKDDRPNLLLLVADDLGYTDLGCYGGEIETPNIDQLAYSGIRFSNFHTSPLCAPTRSMLLSGNDNHIAGMGRQDLQTNDFGYEGRLTDRIVPMPALLRKSGYHTYMAGKWHLGSGQESNPHQKGFEHSFVLLEGAGNHYNDQGLFEYAPVSPYTEDGKATKWREGDYSTDFYTDKLIEYIDLHKDEETPFFAFAAYTSPHWPLQVDERYWKKYTGIYDDGYEKLREKRFKNLKEMGIISNSAIMPPAHESVIPWDSLSVREKMKESRKMELYAGMVDNLDYNIGRLIQHLKDIGKFDNTLIVFMSDNGAAGNDFYNDDEYGPFIREHFNDDFDNMGQPNSFISYGPPWAEAGSSPFKYFKGYTTEGGISAPMIITGPNIERKNQIHPAFVTLMDIAPTFYEAAKSIYPKIFKNSKVYPLKGESILPLASGIMEEVHSSDYVFGLEHANRAMIRKGDWKITNIKKPFLPENFELYNLATDRAELYDLKEKEPQKYLELIQEWVRFSDEVKVQVPTPED